MCADYSTVAAENGVETQDKEENKLEKGMLC